MRWSWWTPSASEQGLPRKALFKKDADILESIKEHSPVILKVTVTTADDELAGMIEPGVPSSTERFELINYLSSRGLFTGILLMPVLPFLEDSPENITAVVRNTMRRELLLFMRLLV